MKRKNIIITISFFIILLVLSPFIMMQFIFSTASLCEVELLKEIDLDHTDFKAVLYQMDCGATSAESFHVSIIEKSEQVKKEPGNIFICKTPVEIKQNPNNTITIKTDFNTAEIFKRIDDFNGIKIIYK